MHPDRLPFAASAAGQPSAGSLPADTDDFPHIVAARNSGALNKFAPGGITRSTAWLDLARMVGLPTSIWVALATLLHGIDCELRSEVVHWSTATFLISISGTTAAVLWFVYRWSYRFLLLACLAGFGVLVGGSLVTEFCETHQFFLTVLASVCLLSAVASWWSQADHLPQPASETNHSEVADEVSDTNSSHAVEAATESESAEAASNMPLPKWRKVAVPVLLLAAFLIYMIVVPTIEMLLESSRPTETFSKQMTDMTLAEKLRLHSVSGVVMLIFLATGASVGSFLNVVIYRLPRRRALLWPPSACPCCNNRIAGKDNIPILGWLNLGGRCRNCLSKISVRYPLIEGICGAFFVLFFYRELLSGGENLAVRNPNIYNGIVWVLLYTKWDLVAIYTFHMIVLVALLAWGMINFDRFRVPRHISLGGSALAFALVAVYPQLNPVTAAWITGVGPLPPTIAGPLLGAIVGGACGYALAWIFPMRNPEPAIDEVLHGALPDPNGETVSLPSTATGSEAEPNHFFKSTESAMQPNDVPEPAPAPELYTQPSKQPIRSCDSMASLALIGVAFGFQAAVLIALVSAVAMLMLWVGQRVFSLTKLGEHYTPLPVSLVLFWLCALHLVVWGQIHQIVNQ